MTQPADPSPSTLPVLAITLGALLAGVATVAAAEPCRGRVPGNTAAIKAAQAEHPEKFKMIARQCNVLEEPGTPIEAAQLKLYDRGASVTIRMSDERPAPAPAAAPLRPAAPSPAVLDGAGRRVLSVAPALLNAARVHGVDPLLMHAVAHVESRHNAAAISPAGARGVMQVMPATGQRFGAGRDAASSLLQADTNAHAAAAYLRALQRRYGDLKLVLAAYNAGEGAVDKHNGIPPYRETQAYVRDVMAVYARLDAEFDVTPTGDIVLAAAKGE